MARSRYKRTHEALPAQHSVEQLDAIVVAVRSGTQKALSKLLTSKELMALNDDRLKAYKRSVVSTLARHQSCDCCGERLLHLYPNDESLRKLLQPLAAQQALCSAEQGRRKNLAKKAPKPEPELVR